MTGSGRYHPDPNGRLCFVPVVPNPPRLEDVYDQLERAEAAVRAFDEAVSRFEVGVLGSLYARLDAVYSSGAEGHTTTFSDLLEYQSTVRRAPDPEDAQAVLAAAQAFDDIAAEPMPPTAEGLINLVRRLHHRLFAGSKELGDREVALGHWKRTVNGTWDDDLGQHFYYAPPDLTPSLLEAWGTFTLDRGRLPELVRQVLSHWMFEHIHPVHDGNGRIGRLLIPITLRAKGTTRMASAFLGEAVYRNREAYIAALKRARTTADWTAWTRFLLAMLAQTAEANLGRLDALAALLAAWRARTRTRRSHSMIHGLVPYALAHPRFTVRDARAALGGTHASIGRAIKELVQAGILEDAGIRGQEHLYQALEVLEVFDMAWRQRAP